ncbi:hypothetical protein [Yersinia phage fHe-Yen9-03]|uniref:Uncharacterized protein n=1 Tax=Yersinia phage fHe-Yen9-03 TaxID=2052743 RepID=A0A2C9CY86_9CAUD|nr:hypothetical protein [Yersinia phage fHe-Yen9-03]
MRLSELLAKLEAVAVLAKEYGNADPDISFWHDEVETIEHLEVAFPQELDDAIIPVQVQSNRERGNFSFRLVLPE